MKLIAISQRVDIIKEYHERRDALDQRWGDFLYGLGYLTLLIPNNLQICQSLLGRSKIEGIVLTGGNDIGAVPERDEVEIFLIQKAIKNNIPLLGVCRGMQMILHYFKVPLMSVENHVGKDHLIHFLDDTKFLVNSYHNFGAKQTIPEIKVVAKAEDGVIEAIEHRQYPLFGVMWHPERQQLAYDVNLFNKIYGNL